MAGVRPERIGSSRGRICVVILFTNSAELTMLPVKKKSKCRTRTRRAHHALKPVGLVACPKCGKSKLPHAACEVCGYVSAKLVLPTGESDE